MNYLGSALLVWLAIALVTLLGIWLAYLLVRLFYIGRKYPGITVFEDLFIFLFTLPSGVGAGYVVFIIPTGISLLIGLVAYINTGEWPRSTIEFISAKDITGAFKPDRHGVEGLLMLGAWIIPVVAVSILRRRKKKRLQLSSVADEENA